jgi:hypothetical protein
MSAISKGNPAARLLEMVTDVRERMTAEGKAHPNATARSVWATILGVSPPESRAALEEYGKVMDLVEQLASWIPLMAENENEDEENARQAVTALRRNLPPHFLSAPATSAAPLLDDVLMLHLRAADRSIRRLGGRANVDDERLGEFHSQLEMLEASINDDPSLTVEARVFALRHLAVLRQALEDVKEYGIDRLRDAVERYVGELIFAHGLGEQGPITFNRSEPGRVMMERIRDFGTIVGTVKTALELGSGERMQALVDVVKAIGPG